jgi:hypothetical protein
MDGAVCWSLLVGFSTGQFQGNIIDYLMTRLISDWLADLTSYQASTSTCQSRSRAAKVVNLRDGNRPTVITMEYPVDIHV